MYTDPHIRDLICAQLAEGRSLRAICGEPGMPDRATVYRWLEADQSFRDRYAQARDAGLDHMADELIQIADDSSRDTLHGENGPIQDAEWVARSRLRVDARKWYLSKLAPKRYGEKTTTELTGANGGPVQISDAEAAAELARLVAAAEQRPASSDVDDLI